VLALNFIRATRRPTVAMVQATKHTKAWQGSSVARARLRERLFQLLA